MIRAVACGLEQNNTFKQTLTFPVKPFSNFCIDRSVVSVNCWLQDIDCPEHWQLWPKTWNNWPNRWKDRKGTGGPGDLLGQKQQPVRVISQFFCSLPTPKNMNITQIIILSYLGCVQSVLTTRFQRVSLICCYFSRDSIFYSPQENVVDLFPDEGSQPQELSINAMQDGLQEVPLPWVLAVKQLQELKENKGQTVSVLIHLQEVFIL